MERGRSECQEVATMTGATFFAPCVHRGGDNMVGWFLPKGRLKKKVVDILFCFIRIPVIKSLVNRRFQLGLICSRIYLFRSVLGESKILLKQAHPAATNVQ